MSRQFAITIPNYISNTPVIVQSLAVVRSVGNASRFDVSINSQPAGQINILDDNEDINSIVVNNLLDIGIGRVPAKDEVEAKNFVDKVVSYLSPQALGPWRNNFTFVADDEDNNLHLQDAEIISATTSATASEFNQQKIYLDAYRQEASPGAVVTRRLMRPVIMLSIMAHLSGISMVMVGLAGWLKKIYWMSK